MLQANTTRGFIQSVLLTMGIMMPETCWVNLLWLNIYTCVICWFFILLLVLPLCFCHIILYHLFSFRSLCCFSLYFFAKFTFFLLYNHLSLLCFTTYPSYWSSSPLLYCVSHSSIIFFPLFFLQHNYRVLLSLFFFFSSSPILHLFFL